MIVDTSSLIAILFGEADAELYARALSTADESSISAANFVETSMIVETQTRAAGSRYFDSFFRRAGIVIEPVTVEHAHLAREAWHDFGKGRHPAGLDFGDCFAYALAKATGQPLQYKGNDFSRTGIVSAL